MSFQYHSKATSQVWRTENVALIPCLLVVVKKYKAQYGVSSQDRNKKIFQHVY